MQHLQLQREFLKLYGQLVGLDVKLQYLGIQCDKQCHTLEDKKHVPQSETGNTDRGAGTSVR